MKILYFVIPALLFSCSKPVKDDCFTDNKSQLYNRSEESKSKYTIQQILDNKPDYLEIRNLSKYRDFKKDSLENENLSPEYIERRVRLIKDGHLFNSSFRDFFWHIAMQQVGNTFYSLSGNFLGYWLLKIENGKCSAYFLGLSRDQYYFNQIQQRPIIDGEYFQAEGSLGNLVEVGKPGGKQRFSVAEDGKLFKIKLKDLEQDSDKDRYNDIFEKSFGLNPNKKDTDGDGVNDFEDMNPMYKSENNKFSAFYNDIMLFEGPSFSEYDKETIKYSFEFFQGDCTYLHQITPRYRVLFIPEDKNKQTAYTRVTDVGRTYISKLFKDKKNPEKFDIYILSKGQEMSHSLQYKDGKWRLPNED